MKVPYVNLVLDTAKDTKEKFDELRVLLTSVLMGLVHWTYNHSPIPQRAIEKWLALVTPPAFILFLLVILNEANESLNSEDGFLVIVELLLLLNILLVVGLLVSWLLVFYIVLLNGIKDFLQRFWEKYTGPIESGNADDYTPEAPTGSPWSFMKRFLIQIAIAYLISFLSAVSGAIITTVGFTSASDIYSPLTQLFNFVKEFPPFFQINRAYDNIVGFFFNGPPDSIFLLFVLIIPALLFTFPVRNFIRLFRNIYHILFTTVRKTNSPYNHLLLGLLFLLVGIIWPLWPLLQ